MDDLESLDVDVCGKIVIPLISNEREAASKKRKIAGTVSKVNAELEPKLSAHLISREESDIEEEFHTYVYTFYTECRRLSKNYLFLLVSLILDIFLYTERMLN